MCAKFHFNCIYLKNSMEGGPFRPPLELERPKKPSINRVKQSITMLDLKCSCNFHKFCHFFPSSNPS